MRGKWIQAPPLVGHSARCRSREIVRRSAFGVARGENVTIECYLGEDDIVYDHSTGEQTAEIAAANIAAMKAAMAGSHSHRLIVDLSDSGSVTREARTIYRDFTIEITGPNADPRWTMCFAGGSPFLRTVVKFIVVASGRPERIGFQPTRQAARDWLLAHYDGVQNDGARDDGVQNG